MSASILFDASVSRNLTPASFGAGLDLDAPRAPRMTDSLGNPLPFGPSASDDAWWTSQRSDRDELDAMFEDDFNAWVACMEASHEALGPIRDEDLHRPGMWA